VRDVGVRPLDTQPHGDVIGDGAHTTQTLGYAFGGERPGIAVDEAGERVQPCSCRVRVLPCSCIDYGSTRK
jgi:hypothetical protein